ncbi:MAG TPA: rhodanese-like domain-containing protein [Acidimicrobiia bacterium]|nr:rhodanese-like domain-containing protein [Acidimicrobiia bacterium]
MTATITRDELQRRIAEGDITVLEALPTSYWEAEHLPGAIAFPLDDIDGQAARLLPDKAAAIAVYCSNAVCNNSHVVAVRLTELGYTSVFRYTEGKQDWIEAGLSVESATPVA